MVLLCSLSEPATATVTPEVTTKEYVLDLNLNQEELCSFMHEVLTDLNNLHQHANTTALGILKVIGNVYFKYEKMREEVTSVMIELNFSGKYKSIIYFFTVDYHKLRNYYE